MKFKKMVFLLFTSLLFMDVLAGCEDMNSLDYTPYYEAKGFKGTEVYCWINDNNEWQCGAMGGTNRNKFRNEILWMQDDLPCSLSDMKDILNTFSEEDRENIVVYEIKYHITEEEYSELYKYLSVTDNTFLYTSLGL